MLEIKYHQLGNKEKNLNEGQREEIENRLELLYGHLGAEMKKTNGYLLVYILDENVYGKPQIINCSEDVLGKIMLMERHVMDK